MKKIALLLLSIISLAFSSGTSMVWGRLYKVDNKKEVWDIKSFGYVEDYDKENVELLKTSAVKIKWNTRKGRIRILSQGINTEEYMIRLFDKDTLRIDYYVIELKANQVLTDFSYIIPKELLKDVKYVEIMAFRENGNSSKWLPKYEIECKDGYKVQESDNYYLANTDLERYILGVFESECVKIPEEVVEEVQEVQEGEEVSKEDKIHSIWEEAVEKERLNKGTEKIQSCNKIELKSLGKNCWGDPNGDYFCE